MKKTFLAVALAFACASASAIDISEATVNTFVARKLAEKRQRDVQVLDPKIRLLDGYATLCATLRSRLVVGDVNFCADMTPKWRPETGSLLASRMALISFHAPGMREQDVALLKELVNQIVLPRLEGVEIYRADDFIGKQISDVKVLPGRLDVSM
ncbi:hypothetical protein [Propionivibrio sp.]|uniref:hypothetical protein n=1 Tax=Propionivibrio sp. TaxID=2212460 RepID=UPI0039E31D2B